MPNLERSKAGKLVATTLFWVTITAAIVYAVLLIHAAVGMKTQGLQRATVVFGPLKLYELQMIPQADQGSLVTMKALAGSISYVAAWSMLALVVSCWRLQKLHAKRG